MASVPDTCDIGLIGLAVMGENLVLNMESKGFAVAVYNRTNAVTQKFGENRASGKNIKPTLSMEEFVQSLKRPRKAMIMVKAGGAVDAVIDQLVPLLEPGDLIIDGGNSLYTDTQRRCKALAAQNINYLGCGVSGGEEGALKGPSMMPGGPMEAWEIVKSIFTKIAAQVEGEPCARYMGPDGSGHYVKTVHNGIEYGDMQLITEAYAILKDVLGLKPAELHDVFTEWNKGDLDSFLIDLTSKIFLRHDEGSATEYLVDKILDKAGQKGTGKWTIMSALDLGVVVSTINAAVEARVTSSMKEQRVAASKTLTGPEEGAYTGDKKALIDAVRDALYASKIVSYAQGMDLLGAASRANNWGLKFGDMATIWRGGCIIRARFLSRIKEAYDRNPSLTNLMLDEYFTTALLKSQTNWRLAVSVAATHGVAVPAFSASLAYFDSYRQANLPANLLQAQRDFFGAHTYERIDKPGIFHTEWLQESGMAPASDSTKQ